MLLRTRFYIPPIRKDSIFRHKLISRLHQSDGGELVLLLAPAGYGKTTLISQWLHCHPHSFAWLILDQSQSTVRGFWQHLIGALQTINPNIGLEAQQLLLADQQQPVLAAVVALLNDLDGLSLASTHSQALTLVLDDFHKIEQQDLLESLNLFLDHLPSNLRLVMTTRQTPSLSLARRRLNGQLIEFQQQDLAFDLSDCKQFLKMAMQVSPSEEAVTLLMRSTEGWVAGLQLAALSLQKSNSVDNLLSVHKGLNKEISDYLFEEVFALQSESIQGFLLFTALPSRFSAGLANQLCELDNGQAILKQLDQLNLFLVPLDNHRTWYRYHDLFRQFLLEQFSALPVVTQHEVHEKSALWLEQAGYLEQAIEHGIILQDWPLVIRLIEALAPEKVQQGQPQYIQHCLKNLPESVAKELWQRFKSELKLEDAEAVKGGLNAFKKPLKQNSIEVLTRREAEVMTAVKAGLNNKQIAQKLNISLNTLKVHIRNLYGKMGVENRTQALLKLR